MGLASAGQPTAFVVVRRQMANTEIVEITELILEVTFARTPIKVRGVLKNNKLEELSGLVRINKSFNEFLGQLNDKFADASAVLRQLTGGPDIKLDSLGFGYRSRDPKFATVAVTLTAGKSRCRFLWLKASGTGKGFIAGLELQLDKQLFKNNPLSGVVGEISLGDMGIYYASDRFPDVEYDPRQEFQDVNTLIAPAKTGAGKRDFNQGVNWAAQILIGGVDLFEKLGKKTEPKAIAPAAPAQPQGKPTETKLTDQTTWFDINKSLGPVSVQRIGLQYAAPRVAVKIDASLQFSVLTLSLVGLGLSYPLDKFADLKNPAKFFSNLRFQLDGAAVAFQQPGLAISGGLLKVNDDKSPLQLDGALVVRVADLSISALGSYADLDGKPSFFAFAVLNKELGGPAFFFVTGLAFGFGINRQLKLPDINEVQNFPLIKAATDPEYLGKNLDLRAVSQKLSEYLAPMPGNFWIAAGVKFTSFRQIDSFALLSVSFGTQFQIALLGLSKILIPKPPAPTIAYAELALKAVFAPELGVLSVEARLTENSYILRKDFKLRGGFAFFSWFAGEHAGDFVVSLGGYHPRFLPPPHYPKPDLVQFYCKTGDVTIQGSCYFAFCPSAIMAGGALSLVYQSGGIKAWFIAYANFLVQWKPLHYDIEIGISVGVALSVDIGIARINISVELGASVNLYGPPLGGEARISLYVVTFTVRFGESKQVPPPLLWESGNDEKSFAKSFLMNPDVTRVVLADGLLEEVKHNGQTTMFVNPHKLQIICRTQTPATAIQYNDSDAAQIMGVKVNGKAPGNQPWWEQNIGVRPMGKTEFYSLLEVTFGPGTGSFSERAKQYLAQFIEISLTTGKAPRALWANNELNTRVPEPNQMVENALLGLEFKTKEGPRPWETPALDLKVLSYDRYTKTCDFATVQPKTELPGSPDNKISTIGDTAVAAKRNAIVQRLLETGRRVMKPEEIRVQELKENAGYIFQYRPLMARVGQYPPRSMLEV